ncbi:hypothetical protein IWX78_002160 [Mycetocola sp. CAN_C7]|uniref:DUF3027 domain-containing protein n=1 Tax=Mycetocola sp. CAN_C7 TaxID=2787724 RepID=UPI0018C9FF84
MTDTENSTQNPSADGADAPVTAEVTQAPQTDVVDPAPAAESGPDAQTTPAPDTADGTVADVASSDGSASAAGESAVNSDEPEVAGDGEQDEGRPDAAEAPPRPAPVADEVLRASVDVARAALLDVTPESTIGAVVGHAAEDDHVLSLFFESTLAGYPGWHWTVTLARVGDDGEPTILETELMPGENALLAPDWVPWSERLADYQASQEVAESEARALAEAAALLDEGDDDEEDDDDEFSILHAGDVDGVDVDEIDENDSDDDESDDDDDDDQSDDDDDDEDDDDESDDDDDDDEDEYGDKGAERSY